MASEQPRIAVNLLLFADGAPKYETFGAPPWVCKQPQAPNGGGGVPVLFFPTSSPPTHLTKRPGLTSCSSQETDRTTGEIQVDLCGKDRLKKQERWLLTAPST